MRQQRGRAEGDAARVCVRELVLHARVAAVHADEVWVGELL
jgi:hypothetical protein